MIAADIFDKGAFYEKCRLVKPFFERFLFFVDDCEDHCSPPTFYSHLKELSALGAF